MKLTAAYVRMHVASLRYQLVFRAMETWGSTVRYCVIVLVSAITPAMLAWLLTRGR